ncbi:MAG: hypothetical protein COV10_03845 [Candidatus Vogelbacteria bacterium CG10_big_fil_rev_8_21_14_0_10_51_16]|uniref:Uncharacterized protein n=1 Tax=Candidatus Vogelbacteria bacterium CG10_big_fil_rev_8_21_14_0_10_51_16 TaxID=1975045 RepID=A0A2H0RDJ5_9BACT|nr:MAG: hypothetical protein COV10_03845 [Candidatus Vogelbacteria bacterium CG10_big_fil_rev_8_21_14_0_10_51_16]
MNEDSKYQKIYTSLPTRLQAAILGADTTSAIETIHRKHKLHIDQMEPLENLTLDVLYGMVRPDEYVRKVGEALGVEEHEAASIAVDMNALVFQPVRAELMGLGSGAGGPAAPDDNDPQTILSEIQNPTPTPLSGQWRRGGQESGIWNLESEDTAPSTEEAKVEVEDTQKGQAKEVEVADQAPASILEEKSGRGARGVPGEDPYLETLE